MPTREQIIAQGQAAFAKFDTNGDGGLNIDECREFFREAVAQYGGEYTEEKYQAAFLKMDSNGDGNISCDEAVTWLISVAEAAALKNTHD